MGRFEAYAMGNKPLPSAMDGIGKHPSWATPWILVVVAFFRELFGGGTLIGFRVIRRACTAPKAVSGGGLQQQHDDPAADGPGAWSASSSGCSVHGTTGSSRRPKSHDDHEPRQHLRQGDLHREHDLRLLPGHVLIPRRVQDGEDGRGPGSRGDLRAGRHRAGEPGAGELCVEGGRAGWLGPRFAEVDLSFLSFIMFIAVVAAIVQLVEMVVEKFAPALYGAWASSCR